MKRDPELEQLVNAVIDGLTAIHGWAILALISPNNPHTQEQALDLIKMIAMQSAHRLQDYMQGQVSCKAPDPL